jgi:hypothetical protein
VAETLSEKVEYTIQFASLATTTDERRAVRGTRYFAAGAKGGMTHPHHRRETEEKSDLTLLLVTGAVDWPEPLTAGRFGQAASRTRQVPDTSTRIPRRALSRPFCVPADEPLFWSGPGIRAGREKARCLLRNNFPWSRSSWPFSAASGSETGPIVLAAKALGE